MRYGTGGSDLPGLCPREKIASRRTFLLSAAALSVGCAARSTATDAPTRAAAIVRPPAAGQSWRYAKHDYFTGEIVDSQSDRVRVVGESIEVESHFETAGDTPRAYPSWGDSWWHKYMSANVNRTGYAIEIHRPWGMVVVDAHWGELQSFENAIPLWPLQLRPGWRITVPTYYMIPNSNETMPWQLTMHAERWESVTVPAGHFTALRCYNIIDFRFTNVSERTAAQRIEHFWFVPEIGRWVRRESVGTFREDLGTEVNESSYRWELLDWT
jgi:hypothetical protein